MKKYLLLVVVSLQAIHAQAQCIDNGNYWNQSWTSCTQAPSPNPDRGSSHWILFEFHEPQVIDSCHVWNANRAGQSGWGANEVIIDYSENGTSWTELGTFTFLQADESENYQGFPGPEFDTVGLEKILITVLSTHDGGGCSSIAELQFIVDTSICAGIIDVCGICDGTGEQSWYLDADQDGLGDLNNTVTDCNQPTGYVSNSTDLCDNGAVGWAELAPLFEDNGCNGCHGNNSAGGLDLRSYETTILGGNSCGTDLMIGDRFAQVIVKTGYDGCASPIGLPSMNDRSSGAFDADELAILQHWINGSFPENCADFNFEVDFDMDGFNADEDCDDNNPEINPDAIEIANNAIDENCDGIVLIIDEDMDGFNSDEDCDDSNPEINPDAVEIENNDIDENCDGIILVIDVDMDGFNSDEDCDDSDAGINPGAVEIANNDIDENCDGIILVIDADMDGFNSDEDCDDSNAGINPDAVEIANNGIDENCDGIVLIIDEDMDGFNSDEDCDDSNAEINPDAIEILNNGIDEDCDGADLISAVFEIDNIKVSFYPNPVSELLNILINGPLDYTIKLYDVNGQLIYQQENAHTINLSGYEGGLYLIELQDNRSRRKITDKIIVVK